MLVLARGSALRQLCSEGRSLTWLETEASGTNRIVSATPTDGEPRALVGGLPQVSIAVAGGGVFVASPELGVRRARDGRLEEIVGFPHASEIFLYGGRDLVAVVAVLSADEPNRYDVHRFDSSGRARLMCTVHDRRPLVASGETGLWVASCHVTDRIPSHSVTPSGLDMSIEHQSWRWMLRLVEGAVDIEVTQPRVVAEAADGVVVADNERIVRVEPSGAVAHLADASYVDGLVAWRDGAAWIEGGTVWCVDSPGAPPRESWRSDHVLREIVVAGDHLAVVEDPETDPLASMFGSSDTPRSIIWL